MKFLPYLILSAAIAISAMPALAGEGKTELPKKISQLDGWHGAKLEKGPEVCKLVFPRNFGKTPAEIKLLQVLAERYYEMDYDLECMLQVNRAVLNQLTRLATEHQDRQAAALIVFAREAGQLKIEGEFSDVYDEAYLYPVLIKYKKLPELISPQKEASVANNVCMARYNPSSDAYKQYDALIKRLKTDNMQSLIQKIDRDCARIKKEMEQN